MTRSDQRETGKDQRETAEDQRETAEDQRETAEDQKNTHPLLASLVDRLSSTMKKSPLLFFLAALLVLLVVIFLTVLFFEVKWVSEWIGFKFDAGDPPIPYNKHKFSTLKSLGVAMGGVILTIQAFSSYKRARGVENAANAQLDLAKAQTKANVHTEQRLLRERLQNGIEHLGKESDLVRLSGAYELFYLARDTEDLAIDSKGLLRQTIFDILCAHIRQKTGEVNYRKAHRSKPSEEIQSLLSMLFRQKHELFSGFRINLRGSWLNGANLTKARLHGASLASARLQEASLEDANLLGISLKDTRLQCANLRGARLQGAVLFRAGLQSASMEKAWLQGAVLGRAGLQGAKLEKARFQGAKCQMDSYTFRARILKSVGKKELEDFKKYGKNDSNGPVFQGGLDKAGAIDEVIEGLSKDNESSLKKFLRDHHSKEEKIDNTPPTEKGVVSGIYDKEQAERWIAEYEAAMAEVPKKDAG